MATEKDTTTTNASQKPQTSKLIGTEKCTEWVGQQNRPLTLP